MAYYYTTDEMSRDGFKPTGQYEVGISNPMYDGLKGDDSTGSGLQDHVYEFVNKWKVAELYFGATTQQVSWRNFGSGIFKTPVDSKVFLYVENMNSLTFDYSNEYDKVEDTIKSKTGFLNKASQSLELMRLVGAEGVGAEAHVLAGGKFVSAYTSLKAWKSTSGLKGMSELTFKFRFGQAGLFDALEEVVKPILVLGSAFAPYYADESGTYMKGPLPTVAEYLVKVGSQFINSIMNDFNEEAKNKLSSTVSGLKPSTAVADSSTDGESTPEKPPETGMDIFKSGVDKLTAFQSGLYKGIDSAISTVMASEGTSMRVFTLKIGRLVAGRFTANGAKMSFDMSQVDERGYPFQGSVTISGMETFMVADRNSILKLFGGSGNGLDTTTPYESPKGA